MRIGAACSRMMELARTDGHPYENRGAAAGRGFDLERRADQRGALAHAEQAESAVARLVFARLFLARVEADAVVLDDEHDLIRPPLENHLDVARARVFGDVG